ncbi:MAG: hypothetical protein A2289_15920 [Deltaproteobacteria bacterium RIFOXYA12_FULL_58_15]|nr:MAG: hypothetical protein A2289_15920 [Deltaproteobacteria bacterium RIFOXYA12_FULL_58_15]
MTWEGAGWNAHGLTICTFFISLSLLLGLFHQFLQRPPIPLNRCPVLGKFLIGHPALSDEHEDGLAAFADWDDAHGIMWPSCGPLWPPLAAEDSTAVGVSRALTPCTTSRITAKPVGVAPRQPAPPGRQEFFCGCSWRTFARENKR